MGFGLIDRSLPQAEWTHAGHFAAALWLLRHEPEAVVRRRMPPMIRAYNAATGGVNTDEAGYHETITLASIAAARAFLDARPGPALHQIVDELMASPARASGLAAGLLVEGSAVLRRGAAGLGRAGPCALRPRAGRLAAARPNTAEPTRTLVAPKAMAVSKSPLMPMESFASPLRAAILASRAKCGPGRLVGRRDAHQALGLEAIGRAAPRR